jgi:general L-amino acid transport system permease protein
MNNKTISWIRNNLFSSVANTILTLLSVYIIITISIPVIKWALIDAHFSGDTPTVCKGGGACWVFITQRFNQFLYGFYPYHEQWRINTCFIIILSSFLILQRIKQKHKKKVIIFLLIPFPIIAYFLFHGGILGLEQVDTYMWGGLHLTLVIATTGIITSIPLGTLLALGRQSTLPAIRLVCIIFIELWRGVPLISILFMSSVLIPLFFPDNMNFDKLLRALIGITLFASAYMAENIRGGLQGIPKGQYEAARSLGIGYWHRMYLVIIPQALKIAIPNIVNTCIGLFKDTTLVLIIGLLDFLAMIQAANNDPKWLAYGIEAYVFAAFGFWIFCFGMSRYSIHLERKLNLGRNS